MIIIDSHVLWEIIQRDLCTIYPISLSDNILHSCCIIITPRIMTSIQFRFPQLYMKWQPTPVFLHAESYGQRSLAGYSPWGCKELDATEWLTLCYMCVCNLVHTWMCSVQFYHVSITTKTLIHSRPASTSPFSPSPPLAPFPILGNLCSAFHFNIFAISRMPYRWNYGVYSLWDWLFYSQYNSLEIHPSCVYL